MTGWRKRTIMEMARETGFTRSSNPDLYDIMLASDKSIERFEALVREDEREACAKLAAATVCDTHIPTGVKIYGTVVAKAIRARGQA
jgi:hypothetical protein